VRLELERRSVSYVDRYRVASYFITPTADADDNLAPSLIRPLAEFHDATSRDV
jgi:hypothetical protein